MFISKKLHERSQHNNGWWSLSVNPARYFVRITFSITPVSICTTNKRQYSKIEELGEVIISFNKWEQQLNEVPNKITKISRTQIQLQQPQNRSRYVGPERLRVHSKSQLGGGSPMIRGFATNRVLLVVDGVRMNNAIYRSGNLQNVISIDPLALEAAEVVFGPGSLIYGSDAIGGVMDFHTLEPRFSSDSNWLVRGAAQARYSSANNENTLHADWNIAGKNYPGYRPLPTANSMILEWVNMAGRTVTCDQNMQSAEITGTPS